MKGRLLFLIWITLLFGKPKSWPGELETPSTLSADGLHKLHFSSSKSYEKAFSSTDYLIWTPRISDIIGFEQSFYYEIFRDQYDISRQYLDISGSLEKELKKDALSLGVDWTPAMNTFRGRTAAGLLLTTDLGPVVRIKYRSIQLLLRSGITGQSRADTLYTGFSLLSETENHPGFYGSFQLGEYAKPFMEYPLHLEGKGFVRSIDGTGMALLTGTVMTSFGFDSGDSLLLYYGDTLFNGKEGYIGESPEGASLINTPWKIERNTRFTAGVQMKERMFISSALWYSLGISNLTYPSDNRMWDGYIKENSIGTQFHTDSLSNMGARVDFGIQWREYERSRSASDTSINDKAVMTEYNPDLNIAAFLSLPLALKFRYDYTISRDLAEYPQLHTEQNLSNDRDRLTNSHRITLLTDKWEKFDAELYGEFSSYILQYLKSHQNSRNRSDERQMFGLTMYYRPTEVFNISESVTAEAKKSDYHFKEFYTTFFNPPWYSRAISTVTSANWQFQEFWFFRFAWDKRFSDYGYWYGKGYMVDELEKDSTLKTDYYAIAGKSVLHSVDLSVALEKNRIDAQLGTKAIQIHDRLWDQVYGTGKKGVIIEPYLKAATRLKDQFSIMLHLSNTLVIGEKGFLGESGVWDFRLHFEGGI